MEDNKAAHAALREILACVGVAAPQDDAVTFSGGDPVFPTPYRVGTAGAAALAATGIGASDLWRLRTGRGQRVAVDVRAAAAYLRGESYLAINGERLSERWNTLSAFYPVRGGRWIRVHCNFPNHRDAMLNVLRAAPDRESVAAAARGWDGVALEDAIHDAGGCAGFVRTHDEWGQHPHAAAVAAEPLIEIAKIAEAPPLPLPPGDRPLAGIRVLDLTRVLAGPSSARTLAEHGAEVLRLTAEHLPDSGQADLATGIGKLSARLDLRVPGAADTLRRLAAKADVFVQSYRPGALAGRGFSPDDLAAIRPGIVYVSLSAWGRGGPWAGRRGFDSIVQSVGGMAHLTGGEGPPRLMPVSSIDYVSGALMAFGAMVALARRATEGGSWLVRVSLARAGAWIVDRGILPPEAIVGVPAELRDEELERLLVETDSPAGRIRHMRPVVALSETPAFWARPPAPLGHHRPAWPA